MGEPSAESLERAKAFCSKHLMSDGTPSIGFRDHLATLLDTIREEERERCAKVCDDLAKSFETAAVDVRETLGPDGMTLYWQFMAAAAPYKNAAFHIRP